MTLPTPPAGERQPDLRHPTWCSPLHCTGADRLSERSVDEQDVPLFQRGAHMSAPITIGIDDYSDTEITLQYWRWIFQRPTEEVEAVDITLALIDRRASFTATITPSQVPALAEALAQIRDVIAASKDAEIPNAAAQSEPDDAAGGSGPGWPIGGAR